jgi:hypothetical protein
MRDHVDPLGPPALLGNAKSDSISAHGRDTGGTERDAGGGLAGVSSDAPASRAPTATNDMRMRIAAHQN